MRQSREHNPRFTGNNSFLQEQKPSCKREERQQEGWCSLTRLWAPVCLSALLNANTQQHKTSVTTSPGDGGGSLCFGVNTRVRAVPSVLEKTVFLAPEAKPGTKVLSCTIHIDNVRYFDSVV